MRAIKGGCTPPPHPTALGQPFLRWQPGLCIEERHSNELDNLGGAAAPCTPPLLNSLHSPSYRLCTPLRVMCKQFRWIAILLNCSSERLSSIRVVKSHHLWLGCCFLCLLSGNARLRLLLKVLCQVLDAGPLPGLLACPPECCEAAAVSALLLQALLASWDRSAFYHTQRHHS